jgi:hypothetical protein
MSQKSNLSGNSAAKARADADGMAAAMRQVLETQSQSGKRRSDLSALLTVLALLAAAAVAKLGAATQFFHIVRAHTANWL